MSDWEDFARSVWPVGAVDDPVELRDDAEPILRASVDDMRTHQTLRQQSNKSKGIADGSAPEDGIDPPSVQHAIRRVISGMDLPTLVAEYRALRASVIRLWRASDPVAELSDLEDLTRFNEAIDQSLAQAVQTFVTQVLRERAVLSENERAAREEAESASRAKDMFLATFSHEIRTPLTAVVGWLDVLQTGGCTSEDLKEGLEVIQRSTTTQLRLIEDMMDVSRIITGKMRLEIAPAELIEIVHAGIEAIRPSANARNISIHVDLDPAASPTSCDAARIQQVVWNLLNNAIKFSDKHGAIRVGLRREMSNVRIDIADEGMGISPELLPHIFDRFRQADSSKRRKFGGLGLGLSIVKHLVEAHGGSVEVTSEGLGHGSQFMIRLPIKAVLMDEDPDASGPDAAAPGGASEGGLPNESSWSRSPLPQVARLVGLRVLIVEDEPDARALLKKVLIGAGAVVTVAEDVTHALAMMTEVRPQLLLSDIGMPDVDGYTFIRRLRTLGHTAAELPAIALTAFVQLDEQRAALDAGFQAYLPKPVTPQTLLATIDRVLESAAVG